MPGLSAAPLQSLCKTIIKWLLELEWGGRYVRSNTKIEKSLIIALNRNLLFKLNHLSLQFNLQVCRPEGNKMWSKFSIPFKTTWPWSSDNAEHRYSYSNVVVNT